MAKIIYISRNRKITLYTFHTRVRRIMCVWDTHTHTPWLTRPGPEFLRQLIFCEFAPPTIARLFWSVRRTVRSKSHRRRYLISSLRDRFIWCFFFFHFFDDRPPRRNRLIFKTLPPRVKSTERGRGNVRFSFLLHCCTHCPITIEPTPITCGGHVAKCFGDYKSPERSVCVCVKVVGKFCRTRSAFTNHNGFSRSRLICRTNNTNNNNNNRTYFQKRIQ